MRELFIAENGFCCSILRQADGGASLSTHYCPHRRRCPPRHRRQSRDDRGERDRSQNGSWNSGAGRRDGFKEGNPRAYAAKAVLSQGRGVPSGRLLPGFPRQGLPPGEGAGSARGASGKSCLPAMASAKRNDPPEGGSISSWYLTLECRIADSVCRESGCPVNAGAAFATGGCRRLRSSSR